MLNKALLLLLLSAGGILLFTSCSSKRPHDKSSESSTEPVTEYTAEAVEETARTEATGLSLSEIMDLPAGTILSEEEMEGVTEQELFSSEKIPDKVFKRMKGRSFRDGCTTKRKELRYLRILHMGFDDQIHIGEIVCHKEIAGDLLDIFRDLYREGYPIEKVLLVDEYEGDDELSMEDNNTSCFNFRPVSGTGHLSQHAYGRAIDINPLYNPYITADGFAPDNAGKYVDRDNENPYKIDKNDLCYQLFAEKGFFWGGDWNSVKDYQHFQKKENN